MRFISYIYLIAVTLSLFTWLPSLELNIGYESKDHYLLLFFLKWILVLISITAWIYIKGKAKPKSIERLPIILLALALVSQITILARDTLSLQTYLDIIEKSQNYPSATAYEIKTGYLDIDGPIGPKTLDSIKEYATKKPVYGISITSDGGLIDYAKEIGEYIIKNQIDTYVFSHCASACVPIALSGKTSYAKPEAKFGFHQGSALSKRKNQYAQAIGIDGTNKLWELLEDLGVSVKILNDMKETPSNSMSYYTGQELYDDGVIDSLI